MQYYVFKRIIQVIPTIIGVSFLAFSLLYLFPGDPAEFILKSGGIEQPTPEMIENCRIMLGLDKPLPVQYFNWMLKILRGDFGTSWVSGEPVISEILYRFPASAELFLASFSIAVIFSFVLGIIAAIYRDRYVDHACRIWSLLGISIPNFWLGLMFIWLFAVYLHWLPSFGYGTLNHAVLPVLTWAISIMAVKSRFIRASILEELNQAYIITAKAKGLPGRLIIFRHALRNALIPIITFMSLSVHHLIIGAVMIEVVFAWPGVGSFFVESVFRRDFPVVQAFVLLSAVTFALTNLTVDLCYALIDPRIKYERGIKR